jgi:hypothetical protein
MNIANTICKATLLATFIFWMVIFCDNNLDRDMLLFVLLSVIPISICCALTIIFTIAPFFWINKRTTDNKTVFKKYFPYYAIVSFGLCTYGFLEAPDIMCFYVSAFFTSLQSWVWLATGYKNKTIT